MKKLIYLLLLILFSITACKKDKKVSETNFVSINQTYMGQVMPLFEFSNLPNPQHIAYNAIVSAAGTTMRKFSYQLSYTNNALTQVRASYGNTVDFTMNANKLITAATSSSLYYNYVFTYDSQSKLVLRAGSESKEEYTYRANGDLEKITFTINGADKKTEILATLDDKVNPMFGAPFVYLHDIPTFWAFFTLVKHNIITLKFTDYDSTGKVVGVSDYRFAYTYDENNRPLTITMYHNNGAYNNLTYIYR